MARDRARVLCVAILLATAVFAGCTQPEDGETTPDPGDGEANETETHEVPGPADTTRSIEGNLNGFQPGRMTVPAGQAVEVTFENTGNQGHNWGVDVDGDGDTEDDARTDTIRAGETASVTFRIDEPGEYTFYCDVPSHRNQGMEGTLVVE